MGVTTALLTVEQFSQLPPDDVQCCELVQGEVICMGNAGLLHETVKSNCLTILVGYVSDHPLGRVYSETMYRLGAREGRIPDVSFMVKERVPEKAVNRPPEGAPDLAFEVVSSESAAFMERKINLYLSTGSRVVWVAYPEERTLWVHRLNQNLHLHEGDYLEEPDLLPGFRVLVGRFFDGI
jgi:Uma2 family endonuclease